MFDLFIKNKLYKMRKQFKGNSLNIKKKACDQLYKFVKTLNK